VSDTELKDGHDDDGDNDSSGGDVEDEGEHSRMQQKRRAKASHDSKRARDSSGGDVEDEGGCDLLPRKNSSNFYVILRSTETMSMPALKKFLGRNY